MDSLTGYLLVAAPGLADPNFDHTVVLIVRHDEDGALGLVLNRPTRTRIADAWSQVSDAPCRRHDLLFQGGPCQGPLMILHDDEGMAQLEVSDGIYFTVDQDHAQRLVRDAKRPARWFVGHSGWSAGQLESELETGAWLTLQASPRHVFEEGASEWERVKREADRDGLGRSVDPRLIPDDPHAN